MENKDINKWTRKEFESLPRPTSYTNENIGEIDSLVILPTKRKHDSGFRCMEFVTVQKGVPTYIVGGGSDVLHLGGIGGYNIYRCSEKYRDRLNSNKTPVVGWAIDCLPTSGLLRLFCNKKMYIGASLSSFEIYFEEN